MMDRTVELTPKQYMMHWLRKHYACRDALELAEREASSLDDAWQRCPDDEYVVWLATRKDVLDEKTLRKFVCFCTRQVWNLLTDQRSRNAVEVAERYADGLATNEELAKARGAAVDAYAFTPDDAHDGYAAFIAANTVASNVSAYIGYQYARAAEFTAYYSADPVAARAEQARWLREHATPNWGHKT